MRYWVKDREGNGWKEVRGVASERKNRASAAAGKPTENRSSANRPGKPGTSGRPTKRRKKRIRRAIGGTLLNIGFFRRMYVKRMIKYIDKTKEKGKRLPPEMMELNRFLSKVPKHERQAKLEEAVKANKDGEAAMVSREMRRTAANQSRRSGRGGGRYRPGTPPRSIQPPGQRVPKKPR